MLAGTADRRTAVGVHTHTGNSPVPQLASPFVTVQSAARKVSVLQTPLAHDTGPQQSASAVQPEDLQPQVHGCQAALSAATTLWDESIDSVSIFRRYQKQYF